MRELGKRGDSPITETALFLVLNGIFFFVLAFFVLNSASGGVVLEQAYSKQIGLIIDNAKPEMTILIDMDEALEISRKNGKNDEDIVKLDEEENEVVVNLGNGEGYRFRYFSDYDISLEMKRVNLVLQIKEKDG